MEAHGWLAEVEVLSRGRSGDSAPSAGVVSRSSGDHRKVRRKIFPIAARCSDGGGKFL